MPWAKKIFSAQQLRSGCWQVDFTRFDIHTVISGLVIATTCHNRKPFRHCSEPRTWCVEESPFHSGNVLPDIASSKSQDQCCLQGRMPFGKCDGLFSMPLHSLAVSMLGAEPAWPSAALGEVVPASERCAWTFRSFVGNFFGRNSKGKVGVRISDRGDQRAFSRPLRMF